MAWKKFIPDDLANKQAEMRERMLHPPKKKPTKWTKDHENPMYELSRNPVSWRKKDPGLMGHYPYIRRRLTQVGDGHRDKYGRTRLDIITDNLARIAASEKNNALAVDAAKTLLKAFDPKAFKYLKKKTANVQPPKVVVERPQLDTPPPVEPTPAPSVPDFAPPEFDHSEYREQ